MNRLRAALELRCQLHNCIGRYFFSAFPDALHRPTRPACVADHQVGPNPVACDRQAPLNFGEAAEKLLLE